MSTGPSAAFCSSVFIVLSAWAFAADLQAVHADQYVYCSIAGQQAIVHCLLTSEDGQLQQISRTGTPGEPGALIISGDGQFLYASMRSTGRLCSFRITRDTGALTLLNTIDVGADPAHISIAPGGRHLFSAYYAEGGVSVHAIADDGMLVETGAQWVSTEKKAHAIHADATGRYVFVPHTGPNRIYRFLFDADQGRLSAAEPQFLQRPENTGPRHLTWNPRVPIAYVDNEQGSSVTAYEMTSAGELQALSDVTTLPQGIDLPPNSNSEVLIHPGGRWLYAANRGHDSIALISVDDRGRSLSFVKTYPTEKTPRSFCLTSDGQWLLAAGQASGRLEVFRVDAKSGTLASVGVHRLGNRLWWVTSFPVSAAATATNHP